MLILLAGVVSRYVFRNPFVWSDELASILFLWLAMLGAVVAFRRGEHMRMSMLVTLGGPRSRAFFEAFAVALAIAFLAFVLPPAIEYAVDEAAVLTPALEIPNVWRASAVPVGCGLMLDGFGRLSTSFSALKALQVDYVKVDGSLVRKLLTDAKAEAKLRAIQKVGETMGFKLIAEMVEDQDILLRLKALGVAYAQGFGICQPHPIELLARK